MANTKKLGILVPMYKEDESVVKGLLDSIQIQRNIDFKDIEVIICVDGTEPDNTKISDLLLSIYDFDIQVHYLEHQGVSAMRNAALDFSSAEYIIWCDCDDAWFNTFALHLITEETKGEGFDVIIANFIEETRNPMTGDIMYVDHPSNSTFVHGQWFRRQYLLDNDLRFDPECTIHEDSRGICLFQKIAKPERVKIQMLPTYAWLWRSNSVCRSDRKYILKTMVDMIKSNTSLVNELLKRDHEEDAIFYVTGMVFDCYWTLNEDSWMDEENKQYRDNTEQKFKAYWTKYKYLYEKVKPEVKLQIMSGIRQRKYMEGLGFEKITFDQWIKHIEEMED